MKRSTSLRIPSSAIAAAQAQSSPLLRSPVTPGAEWSTDEERLLNRRFVRQLLEAFVEASREALSRFPIGEEQSNHGWNLFFRRDTGRSGSVESVVMERGLRQLQSLRSKCIEDGADRFARLLLPPSERSGSGRKARIEAALSMDEASPASSTRNFTPGEPVTVADAYTALRSISQRFRMCLEPARVGPYHDPVTMDWIADWRCQAVLWMLIKRLGNVVPPSILSAPFAELKEAIFACLFEVDFVDKQWKQCSFRQTFLKYIPRPGAWDADCSWVGVAFFVALPLTGFIHKLIGAIAIDDKNRWGSQQNERNFFLVYWGVFAGLFFGTAAGMVLFYSAYRSKYSERLMRRAAVGTRYEAVTKKQHTEAVKRLTSVPANLNQYLAGKKSTQSKSSDALDVDDEELSQVVVEGGNRDRITRPPAISAPALPTGALDSKDGEKKGSRGDFGEALLDTTESQDAQLKNFFESGSDPHLHIGERQRSLMSPARAVGFHEDEKRSSGAMLRLYQAAMFVQRIYGSTYFDESWVFGLSESSLYNAIKAQLASDGTLGRQYAAFSFTSIAVASRGVPEIERFFPNTNITSAAKVVDWETKLHELNYGIFSYLCGLTFICGITAAVLSDTIMRQMSFTHISREGTAHFFAHKFGFFIRTVGSLNSLAGTFLSSALLHFLLTIFSVNSYAVLILAGVWLICGTVVTENFFSNFHFWRMSEILDDVDIIAEPDVLSPSPLTGALQFIMARLRKLTNSGHKQKEQRRRALQF